MESQVDQIQTLKGSTLDSQLKIFVKRLDETTLPLIPKTKLRQRLVDLRKLVLDQIKSEQVELAKLVKNAFILAFETLYSLSILGSDFNSESNFFLNFHQFLISQSR